jgi:hypothetical protein
VREAEMEVGELEELTDLTVSQRERERRRKIWAAERRERGWWRWKTEMERGAASWRVEAERGAAPLLECGGRKSEMGKVEAERGAAGVWTVEAENLKWANGKGESKIWYLYLGFVRAF